MSITREIVNSFPVKDRYDLLLRKETYSYYVDRPFERLIKDVKWELDELLTWIQNQDIENIKEETADVIFNTLQLIQALMKNKLISPEDLQHTGQAQKQKIYKRQPQLRHGPKPNSWEEETELFKKLKEQSKTWEKSK